MNAKTGSGVWKCPGRLAALVWVAGWVLAGLTSKAQEVRNIVLGHAGESCWAVVIGADAEQGNPEAVYRTNDAELLAAVLEGCGYRTEHLLLMSRRASEPGLHPLQANIQREVARFLRRLRPKDRLLVYFTGRAHRDGNGEFYLVTSDWDKANPTATGLPVAWLGEQLEACAAESKLVALDIAGGDSASGASLTNALGEQIGCMLEGVPDLVILASCRAGDESLVWEPVEQSLFGFWFSQGLAGHADRNGDKRVSTGELEDYVFEEVAKTSRMVQGKLQRPVRLGQQNRSSTWALSQVQVRSLREALDRMAEQLAAMGVQNSVGRLGVAEFHPVADDRQAIELLNVGTGIAGRWCAEELERRLRHWVELAGEPFELVPHHALHTALVRGGFSPASFRSSTTRGIAVRRKHVQTVVLGSFCARTGPLLTLRCDLRDTKRRRLLGRIETTALLNESEWGMFGLNGSVDAKDRRPPAAPSPDNPFPGSNQVDQTIAELDESAQEHPAGKKDLPFRVTVYVNEQPRESVLLEAGECVPLAAGEVYVIQVENRSDRPVYLRLLVDGLNTLDEPVRIGPEGQQTVEYLPHQRVSLDEARAWRLEPRQAYWIQGFYHRSGQSDEGKADYEWDTFKVVAPPESLAYQQGYTEQIGLITAMFCEVPEHEPPGARTRALGNVGTGAGKKRQGKIEEYQPTSVGRLLAVFNIHYVEPEVLERLQRAQTSPAASKELNE